MNDTNDSNVQRIANDRHDMTTLIILLTLSANYRLSNNLRRAALTSKGL